VTDVTESRDSALPVDTAPHDEADFVGVVTRAVSWVLDALLINLAAIMAGLGTALILSLFPLAKSAQKPLQAIAGVAYILWAAAYFVAFWSTTGQTPGARVMQIRLVVPSGRRVKPVRALLRWVGMNLAMLPLFAGYLPIVFGRRGFPDWLARTSVIPAPQMSVAEARRATLRAARARGGPPPAAAAALPEVAPGTPDASDGRTQAGLAGDVR
jgi:uncharacterized RDD family membrane protein YckC